MNLTPNLDKSAASISNLYNADFEDEYIASPGISSIEAILDIAITIPLALESCLVKFKVIDNGAMVLTKKLLFKDSNSNLLLTELSIIPAL